MRKEDLLDLLAKHKQHDIIKYYKKLTSQEQMLFLKNVERFDLKLIFELHKKFSAQNCASRVDKKMKIEPAPVIAIPATAKEREKREKARQAGESLLRKSKVAVLIVAGGQGSRLGFEGPKGLYQISPIKKKSLFQLFAEQINALTKCYSSRIPIVIMTSEENHNETNIFFEDNNFFGVKKENIHFFQQDMLPAVTPDGKLILQNNSRLFANPNGHGGSLKGLNDSGILGMLIDKGFTELFYCQVDNPLVKIADPVFLGYHAIAGSEVSTKVVRRRSIEEKVGVYLSCNGKDTIVEYSDLGLEYMSALDEKSNILYWAGNTAIHLFSLPFIHRINNHGFSLPYHCARKKIEILDENGKPKQLGVWKFEAFVFDAIPLAEKACCLEVSREEEFAPVKNRDGSDSPETARSAMVNLHQKWLRKAGANVASRALVEISPLFALNEEELGSKLKEKNLAITNNTYFG